MTKVLLVDDDIELGNLVNMALSFSGYEVHYQNSLAGINGIITEFEPNIIVLDVEIGQKNGIEEAKEIHQLHSEIPIIFISSHTDIENISKGLEVGGVSYLKKPFEVSELEAYIQRFSIKKSTDNLLRVGNFALDIENSSLLFNDQLEKHLSPMEANAIQLFFRNQNNIVTREEFCNELWGHEMNCANDDSLNNLMSKIRSLLKSDSRLSIQTLKSKGYMLKLE